MNTIELSRNPLTAVSAGRFVMPRIPCFIFYGLKVTPGRRLVGKFRQASSVAMPASLLLQLAKFPRPYAAPAARKFKERGLSIKICSETLQADAREGAARESGLEALLIHLSDLPLVQTIDLLQHG